VLVGIAPPRLAFASRRRYPRHSADQQVAAIAEQALRWQQTAGNATFWEMGAIAHGTERNRVYALAGQMAAAGEQLGLAQAAAGDVTIWRDARKDPADPEHEMCMRGMAEAQTLFIMGTGHALANVAVRALALKPKLRDVLVAKFGSNGFEPFSQDRCDWVSLNPKTCRKIRDVAQLSEKPEVTRLVEPIVDFASRKSWKELWDQRGEDFHRWRLQTHGIEGVPRGTPWTRKGNSWALNIGHPSYEEAQGLADRVAGLADAALLDIALAMETFLDRWPAASGPLGGPQFKEAKQ